jgi:hypothetical protein
MDRLVKALSLVVNPVGYFSIAYVVVTYLRQPGGGTASTLESLIWGRGFRSPKEIKPNL